MSLKKGSLLYNLAALTAVAGLLTYLYLWVPKTPDLPSPPLKVLAANRGLEIGNYASLRRLGDKPYTDILTSQYSFVTNDGELNWTFNDGSLRPSPERFDFSNPDKVFDFAAQHNLPVEAHHLVWGEEKWLPTWLKNGHYNQQQLLEIIHQHIMAVAGHYQSRVRQWTVVNEAFTRGQRVNDLRDWWGDNTGGKDYIDQAFIWAHQTDPSAKLLMNDFKIEDINPVSDELYSYVKGMKLRGVPIDGIGMQMHIDGNNPPDKDGVIVNMQRFGALGLSVYVTEFDVNMNQVSGSQRQRLDKQAQIYYDMVQACVLSKVCHSFAELGITDRETWYNDLGWTKSQPLPFDNKYNPKPAFYALRKALIE